MHGMSSRRRSVGRARASAGTSSGAVSRSLIRSTEPFFTLSAWSIARASCMADEMRVPARNVSDHGLTTPTPATGVSIRTRPLSSDGGVPGGSSS